MKREPFLEWVGFRFIVNHHTKEIHRVKSFDNCKVKLMRHAGYATWIKVWYLIRYKGYNGCRWCYREKDKG
jgi:hypothetical protein